MTALDRGALLAHLDKRADHTEPLVHAIFAALAIQIRRGDYDQKEDT